MGGLDTADQKSLSLPRVLGPVQAYCVVVGCVIGSGIFLVPATVAHEVPFIGGIALVWIVGGLFSAAGALTLAEEIREPGRNIPRSLMLGMATLIVVYLGMTLAYH